METKFSELIRLFRCAVQEEACTTRIQSNIRDIMEEAGHQQIGTLIFPAVRSLYEAGQTDLSPEEFTCYEQVYTQVIMKEVQRQYALFQTIREVEANGVPCCLLKGAALSMLYPVPEARISGDADFYIGEAQEQAVCTLLREKGFTVLERPATSHHAMCRSAATGLIEFHLTLYDSLYEDVWFNHLTFDEPWQKLTTQDGYTYHVLGVTDQAIFITLHLIKHFLSEGVGIRQVMDVLLYLRKYGEAMDVKRYCAVLKELRYEGFMQVCLQIGTTYLGFTEESLVQIEQGLGAPKADAETVESVLYDMACGGVFGQTAEARKNFYMHYTAERYQRFKEGNFFTYIGKWNLRRVFPSRAYMKTQYECLQKHPILLPILYVKRIAEHTASHGRKSAAAQPTNSAELEQRMQLVHKLNMI